MAFNGTEGAPITLDVAGAWTENYRTQNPTLVKGVFYGRDILEQILAQPGCQGIRFYFALDNLNKNTLVAVGADAQENDQLNGVIADVSSPCPPHCGSSNQLNS